MVFAFVLSALVLGVSVALTTLQLTDARNELQTAADSAALAAVRLGEEGSHFDKTQRKARAAAIFAQNLSSGYDPDFDIDLKRQNGVIEARVTSRMAVDTPFGGMLSDQRSEVAVNAFATSSERMDHVEIYFLVDNSASMGIGQTALDRDRMIRDPNIRGLGKSPCSVACHRPSKPDLDTYDYYQSQGIRMRIDVVRDRVVNFLTQLDAQDGAEKTRVAVRVTGDWEDGEPSMLHTTLTGAIADARAIELEGRSGRDSTIIAPPLRALAANITRPGVKPGDGRTDKTPKTFVVLLTDGLENISTASPDYVEGGFYALDADTVRANAENYLKENDPALAGTLTYDEIYDWGRGNLDKINEQRLQTLPPETCDIIKDTGATLIVMNIEYGVPDTFSRSNGTFPRYDSGDVTRTERDRVQAVVDAKAHMRGELEQCASSPLLVFDAETDSEMIRAFDAINDAIYRRKDARLAEYR